MESKRSNLTIDTYLERESFHIPTKKDVEVHTPEVIKKQALVDKYDSLEEPRSCCSCFVRVFKR